MVSACVRREQVAYVRGRGVSLRTSVRAAVGGAIDDGYESTLAKRDAPVVAAMRELAAQYPRFGYRRIQVFLERRGMAMSADRAHRIWRRAGLQVPRKTAAPASLRRTDRGQFPRPVRITSGRTTSCSMRAPTDSS